MRTDRFFARLEQEPQRPAVAAPGMSRTRIALLWATLGAYATIVAAVLSTSWLVRFDWQVMLFRPYKQWPGLHAFLDYFVVLGQRGPTAVLVAAWLGWRSWRQRTLRPLLVMGVALLALNLSVGAAKLGMAREGPHYANDIGSNEMWLNGDIFPSGHTANAVVTWGILAYLATTPRARRTLSIIAAVFALGVGATTVYLGTHWVSDVLLGWAAGLLILLALPWCEPVIREVERRLLVLRDRLSGRPGRQPHPVLPPPDVPPVTLPPDPASAPARAAALPARLAKAHTRSPAVRPLQTEGRPAAGHPGVRPVEPLGGSFSPASSAPPHRP
ncbi:hypothetical protein GCM10009757_51820 [Streptomyces cheonanensis]